MVQIIIILLTRILLIIWSKLLFFYSFPVGKEHKGTKKTNLCHEHCSRRNLHVMSKLEILQEGDPLFHAYVPINFKTYVGDRISWINVPDDILCDHI